MLPPEIATLPPNEQAALSQFMQAVRDKFGPRLVKAFLYGSKARGDAEEFSDIDILLVIEAVTYQEEKDISHLSWEAGFENQALIMAAVYSREQYEIREDLPFLSNVRREGIPL